ncbi:hypothetical protein Enr13x_15910 [Stieleria neptunia]|uniref:Uncharacterized protein n=1 Tax=Stieleria neptunia TaxID=2527979 RepID=A0A518HLR2_9BACT|nr:hypothetical protein Enr13x_15910 [Stieleria neptunia]
MNGEFYFGYQIRVPNSKEPPPRYARLSRGESMVYVTELIVAAGTSTVTAWALSGVCLLRKRRLSQRERN